MMLSQAKEFLEPPEAETVKEEVSPGTARENVSLQIPRFLDFWPPEVCENKFLLFISYQACGNSLWQS